MPWMFTMVSRNAKTGPMPVTTSAAQSCPSVCPYKRNGCYADAGPLRRLWDKLSTTPEGGTFPNGPKGSVSVLGIAALCSKIASIPRGMIWRHNQAGDLSHDNGKIDGLEFAAIITASIVSESKPFTYTHHAMLGNSPMARHNRGVVEAANKAGFTVNLSGNNLHHADKLAALAIAPVVSVVHSDTKDDTTTPQGRRVVICPATIREGVNCLACGMCQLAKRDFIIAFPAHGNSVRKANEHAAA